MNTKIRAEESPQICKARKKLEDQIKSKDKKLTYQALDRIRKSMHRWIDRYAMDRVNLRGKSIALFDENQHPAKIENKFIINKLKNLKMRSKDSTLAGRIKTSY